MTTDRSKKMKRSFRSKSQEKPKIKAILRRTWMDDLKEYGVEDDRY